MGNAIYDEKPFTTTSPPKVAIVTATFRRNCCKRILLPLVLFGLFGATMYSTGISGGSVAYVLRFFPSRLVGLVIFVPLLLFKRPYLVHVHTPLGLESACCSERISCSNSLELRRLVSLCNIAVGSTSVIDGLIAAFARILVNGNKNEVEASFG